MFMITDLVGASGSVTVNGRDDIVPAIRPWYVDAPAEVSEVLDRLDDALRRHEYTGEDEAYLGIHIDVTLGYSLTGRW